MVVNNTEYNIWEGWICGKYSLSLCYNPVRVNVEILISLIPLMSRVGPNLSSLECLPIYPLTSIINARFNKVG